MNMISKISIIGGDLRIVKLAEMLSNEGAKVYTYGLESSELLDDENIEKCKALEDAMSSSDIILGPIPFTSNGESINSPFSKNKISINEVLDLSVGKTLIAGGIKQNIYEMASQKNVKVIDILKREELAVLNAVSTAEGTIKIAIEETLRNLHGSNILILGFGRVGKILANMLKGLGSNVACEARKNSDIAWIKAYGYEAIPLSELTENLDRFDIIINTIPYIILGKENLDKIKEEALIIDLASSPGGVDREAVKEKNIKFIWALSLPGKVAPITSAEFIEETLYNIIKEIREGK